MGRQFYKDLKILSIEENFVTGVMAIANHGNHYWQEKDLLYILCFSSFIDLAIQTVFPNLDTILQGKVLVF